MKKVYILFNPKSGNGTGEAQGKKLANCGDKEVVFCDITKVEDYSGFFGSLNESDLVVVAGGDGTLSRFAHDVSQLDIKNSIYYYATGSGNDFLKDLGYVKGEKPFPINEYIASLPVISVNGNAAHFVNGVGGGLDAYACVEGNKMHEQGKKANYVAAALKGIFYDYNPMNAHVVVDGKEYDFKNVWFASVMKGRYFGGGIMLAPQQDRNSGTLSVVVVHTVGRVGLLPIIPQAFEGKHVRYKKYVEVIEGNSVKVTFDRPVPVQIDGETIDNVTQYGVETPLAVL